MIPHNGVKLTPTQKARKIPMNYLRPQIRLQLLSEMLCGNLLQQQKITNRVVDGGEGAQHGAVTILGIQHTTGYLMSGLF